MSNKIDWDTVYEYLEGTNYLPSQAIDYFDLNCTVEEVEEEMLNRNLEQCPSCDYWVESGELVDENGDLTVCDNCK